MSALMYSQMGLAAVSGLADFANARSNAALQQRIQNYRNTMSALSAARSRNAVTENQSRLKGAALDTFRQIQQRSLQDQATAEVEAAAAGVTGNSVRLAVRDLRSSASLAKFSLQRQTAQQIQELGAQKTTISLNALMNRDTQVIPKPSIGAAMLGIGANILSIYDSHQTPGNRLLGPNGGRVNSNTLL